MSFVQDVLIGFVTNHDPVSPRGLANIVTAAKALTPQVVYLLYTEQTEDNYKKTKRWLESEFRSSGVDIPDRRPLSLADVTHYGELAQVMRDELSSIAQNHPGAHFHLVSGLCQARIVFALCLFARIIDGTLWEVNPPASPDKTDKESCQMRLERWPVAIFHGFSEILRHWFDQVRLSIDLTAKQARIDGQLLALRSRYAQKGLGSRTFQTLVVLAAKKKYGAGDEFVTGKFLGGTIYQDVRNPYVSIHQAMATLNAQAAELSQSSKRLSPLVIKEKGGYKLTDELNPPAGTIEFIGSLREYLQGLGMKAIDKLFPALPPS